MEKWRRNWLMPTRRNHRGWAYGPRAGDGYDKGHALSHAQGGLEYIFVYDERGLFSKAKGSGPNDGLLGFTSSTVT